MSDKQPEALRLADALDNGYTFESQPMVVYGWADDCPAWDAAAELRHLHAECEALRADAERYRWLRVALSDRTKNGKSHHFCSIAEGHPEQLDKDIDAARAAKDQP